MFTGFDKAVVADVETTGLNPKMDRIVSVALFRVNFGKLSKDPNNMQIIDGWAEVFNPQCPIPQEASNVHGITDKDVIDKTSFSDNAQEIREFIGDLPIIAHNASFGKGFLSAEFMRAGVKTLHRNKSYCTMYRYREFNYGHRKGSNLDDVVETMGVGKRKKKEHDALEDVTLTSQVAGLFYMMDNNIDIPGGKPVPPSRGKERDEYVEFDDYDDSEDDTYNNSGSSVVSWVVAIIVVMLLAWWIF